MAEIAVSILVNQLSVLLKEEHKLLSGFTSEIQITHDQLLQIRAFLRVADEKEETDPQLKLQVTLVRNIAYEIEDVLENYMLRCAGHPSHGILGHLKKVYASIKNLRVKHKTASRIKNLRSRARNASETFSDLYPLHQGPSPGVVANNACYDGRDDALLLEEAEVVGIEESKKRLLDWISTGDHKRRVVSVVGMAGLGKTTLVKKVYDDPLVKEKIGHHGWITVSQSYNIENLLRELIMKLLEKVKEGPPPQLETMKANALKVFIHNFLDDKNYLIVLDDVWSIDAWQSLQYAFPRRTTHGQGCIIITTRSSSIGEGVCCGSDDLVYCLKPLPDQKAEELFYKKAFRGNCKCPPHLKEISENILKSIRGLPLAIVVIAGVLATKGDEIGEWRKLSSNLGLELGGDLKRIQELLSLSYYDLPCYLKSVLLYLSIFPEDTLLEKSTIIRLWRAEGLVESKQGTSMEDIAEGYLKELCNRSLIQVADTSDDGRANRFRIHDLVREYIISKAREQNMIVEVGVERTSWDGRRLRLDDASRSHIMQIDNFKCLRTLLFFGSTELEWGSIIGKVLNGGCRMLKELDLRGTRLGEIPEEVFKLYHLKYLCLRNTNVSIIPKSIGNLVKLETLDLKESNVTEMPIEIRKLQRLQYLLVCKYGIRNNIIRSFEDLQGFKAPFEIGELLCMEKLYFVEASVSKERNTIVREIGKLKELRTLGIVKVRKEDGEELCSSLAKLTYLSSLSISSLEEDEIIELQYCMPSTSLQSLRTLVLRGRLEKVPEWITSLNALKSLILRSSKLGEDADECLQVLPNLQVLSLSMNAYEGEGLSFKCGGFQRLSKLYLTGLSGLRWVRVEMGSMPNLTYFDMTSCKAMIEAPMGLEHLSNLDTVFFDEMKEEFVEKLYKEEKREGKEWKFAHVSIGIGNWIDGQWKRTWL